MRCARLKGSPTKVKQTFVPPRKGGGVVIQEDIARDAAGKLVTMLSGVGLI